MQSSLSIWHYVVSVKSMVKISSFFVAFLENTNFINPKEKVLRVEIWHPFLEIWAEVKNFLRLSRL